MRLIIESISFFGACALAFYLHILTMRRIFNEIAQSNAHLEAILLAVQRTNMTNGTRNTTQSITPPRVARQRSPTGETIKKTVWTGWFAVRSKPSGNVPIKGATIAEENCE